MKQVSLSEQPTWRLSPGVILLALTLVAFSARVWQLSSVPPGWRDDELINSLVISQKVLDGEWALYYPDASGHEALYHILNAGMLALFGPGAAGIRLISAILGTLSVPLVYLVGKRLFGIKVGLVAAAGLAISFWALMYSRIGIRHVSLPFFLLATFYFFLRGMSVNNSAVDFGGGSDRSSDRKSSRRMMVDFAVAGIFMGLGFYTYFAARGTPVILLAFLVYIMVFYRKMLVRRWQGLLAMFALSFVLAVPLVITLAGQPESEARVQELAVPLVEAQAGNFQPLREHVVRTINMFHSDGDEEWLYNIPFRPIFAPLVAVVFWSGMAITAYYSLKPIIRFLFNVFRKLKRRRPLAISMPLPTPGFEIAGAFLLIWWIMGIIPAFASVPPASLGHTIIAQPATYIVLAVPVFALEYLAQRKGASGSSSRLWQVLPIAFAVVLLLFIAGRDLPDYFQEWPSRGMTRFLYRADLKELASYLNQHPEMTEFGVTGLLAGPWDGEALAINLANEVGQRPRWFDPERVVLLRVGGKPAQSFTGYPVSTALEEQYFEPIPGETAGGYRLATLKKDIAMTGEPVCFQNNLCLLEADYDPVSQRLDLMLELDGSLEVPSRQLISNPPPPGIYAGARLHVFSQLLDEAGELISSDDGMWIDVHTFQPGDRFLQQHRFNSPPGINPKSIIFGLYDPLTGERIMMEDGRDHLRIELGG